MSGPPAPPPPAFPTPPGRPRPDDDDFEAPESDSLKKLVRHIVDEMPGHVIVAIAMVAFMFFYGMANSMQALLAKRVDAKFIEWTGEAIGATDPSIGPWTGLVGSVVTTILILRIKYRKK